METLKRAASQAWIGQFEHALADFAEAQKYPQQVQQAMIEELQRWLSLGAFERMPKEVAQNVIDARWVLKWKKVYDQWRIQARLVVRGF